MKCPNCSFNNPDSADICKVCGYTLHPNPKVEKNTVKPELRKDDASDDIEIDATLAALFGKRDAAKKSAALEQEQQKQETLPKQDIHEVDESNKTSLQIIGMFAIILLLLVVFLTSSWSKLPWKYIREESAPPSGTVVETVPTDKPEVITPSPEETINAFISALPSFINEGNISILSLFENPDDAIDHLMGLKSIGKIETLVSIDPFTVTTEDKVTRIQTKTVLDCKKDDSVSAVDLSWDFQLVLNHDKWVIQAFSTEGLEVASVPPIPDTTTPAVQPPVQPPKAIPTGFKATGTFSGGESTSPLDLTAARFGDNTDFERIVFDFKDSSTAEVSETVSNYTASLSENGKIITIDLKGIQFISAQASSIDFKGSKTIKSIDLQSISETQVTRIVITLNQKSHYKVFYLKEPGRLIVDYIAN